MVKQLIGFNTLTGDRVETIAFTSHTGCAEFQIWVDSKLTGVTVHTGFDTLSQAENFGRQKLNSI